MFIEMLRNRSTIMSLGYITGGLVGDVDIPKQIGGAEAYWVGEDEEVNESGPKTGQLKLSLKTVAGRVEITRKLMQQSSPSAEQQVWNDLNQAIALKLIKQRITAVVPQMSHWVLKIFQALMRSHSRR